MARFIVSRLGLPQVRIKSRHRRKGTCKGDVWSHLEEQSNGPSLDTAEYMTRQVEEYERRAINLRPFAQPMVTDGIPQHSSGTMHLTTSQVTANTEAGQARPHMQLLFITL